MAPESPEPDWFCVSLAGSPKLIDALTAYLKEHPECSARIVQPTGSLADVINGNDAIGLYLQGLSGGRPMTPRSWFGETESPEQLLSQVKSIIESTKIKSSHAEFIKQFDLSYESKFGPQGGTPPLHETVDIILKGFTPNPVDYSDPLWLQAKNNLVRRYKFNKTLKPWSYKRVIEDKASKGRLSRYAGFPTGGKKRDKANQALAIKDATSGKCFSYPAMILFRFYRGKLRLLWMYPFSMTLRGASYESALIEYLRKLNLVEFTAWEGFEDVKKGLTKIWDPKRQIAFGGDTTAMDDHMQLEQNLEAYDVIKYAFEERYWEDLRQVIAHENDIPLLISDDVLITGLHGKASGADFTQMSETIYQAIVHEYIRLHDIPLIASMYIGDDFEAVLNGLVKWAEKIVGMYEGKGLPGKIEKQSDEVGRTTFLQRAFVEDWKARGNSGILGGIYSITSALRSLVYPENWIDPEEYKGRFSDMFCIKVAMIVENTVDSPYFEPFAKWAAHKQKDLIPFAHKSLQEMDRIWRASKSVRGIGESYNQEKQDKPISSYACIAIWRKM